MLKYPIPKEKRIHLIRLYYHLATLPGMPTHIIATASDSLQSLTRSRKKSSIEDLRLPWKPLFNILKQDLFLTRRQFEIRFVHTSFLLISYLMAITVKHRGIWDTLLIMSDASSTPLPSTRCYPPLFPC